MICRWEEVEAKIVLVLNEAVNKTCKILVSPTSPFFC